MKSILFCCIILLMVSVLYCKDIEVPFNVADVIKQATEHSKFENAQVDYRWDSKGFYFPGSRFGEFLIDTNVVYVPGHTNQSSPSVAFDGTNYLVVWHDCRSGLYPDIYGTRVNQSGIVLDPDGIAISTGSYYQKYPSVAFDGTNYLIVWQDSRNSPFYDIYGAILSTSMVVIDSFDVSLQSGEQLSPALAHGQGEQLLITYSGWTEEVGGKVYNTTRIWGKFNGFIGPQIFISPSSFNITLKPDESRIEPLTISNSGDEILTWSISENPP